MANSRHFLLVKPRESAKILMGFSKSLWIRIMKNLLGSLYGITGVYNLFAYNVAP